jgi:hypothetical protein
MNDILLVVVFVLVFIGSAVCHENDIYNACVKYGKSSGAMWTHQISCQDLSNRP